MLIKGRALSEYGLRAPRTSSDVDVFVDPAYAEHYCSLLVAAGWESMPETFSRDHFIIHSRTYRHSQWPIMVDVHHAYPGFLNDNAVVFHALWERRTMITCATKDCEVADRISSIAILALHCLRGSREQIRHQIELDSLLRIRLDDHDRAELARFIREVGATVPLSEVTPKLGIDLPVDPSERKLPTYVEWRRKVASSHGGAASWLVLLKKVSWRKKPAILLRAIWPSRHDMLINTPGLTDHAHARVLARISRWRTGIQQLPAAIDSLRGKQ